MAEPNKPIIAWMGYWSGAGSVDSVTKTTHFERVANEWKADGAQITPLYADLPDAVKAIYSAPPVEPQGEAVAYRLRAKSAADQGWRLFLPDDDGLDFYRSRKPEDDGGAYDVQPLYAAPPSPQSREGTLDLADDNDGKEQDAFEEWAASEDFNMERHPLHWLFLNEKTDAARSGWRAGIRYARVRALSQQER